MPSGVQAPVDSPCVPWPLTAGVQWGDDKTETLLAILLDGQHHEKLQTRQHSQTYRAVAEQLWEQGFLRTPEQCRTKFNSLWSRYHKVRPGRVPELSVLNEEVDAVSGSWASAPKVASRAVPGQEGRAAESGERSQQNGEPTEVGEGVWADSAAGDEEDFRDPSWEGGRLDLPVLFPPRAGRTPDSDSQGTGVPQSPLAQLSGGSGLCCWRAHCPDARPAPGHGVCLSVLRLSPLPIRAQVRIHQPLSQSTWRVPRAAPFLGFLVLPGASSPDSLPFPPAPASPSFPELSMCRPRPGNTVSSHFRRARGSLLLFNCKRPGRQE